jgi:hypothetical protein
MGKEYSFSVRRSGTLVSGLTVRGRLDDISAVVIAGSGGAIPYNSKTFISLGGVPDVRQGDMLIDTHQADTNTPSGYAEYRVSGSPEEFDTDHLESQITRVVSKTP